MPKQYPGCKSWFQVDPERHQQVSILASRMRWGNKSTEQRFWEKVQRGSPDECWPWLAAKGPRGYGRFMLNYRSELAPRVAYALENGEIPEGLYICHSCDNPPCCNPAHLYADTQKKNIQDCRDRGRLAPRIRGEENRAHKLTNFDVSEIRNRWAPGLRGGHGRTNPNSTRSLGKEFGVCCAVIRQIVHRKKWTHI